MTTTLTAKIAELSDIDQVLALHGRYHIDSINDIDKKDGFITTAFTTEQLERLIVVEQGLFIVTDKDKVIAYAMSASWDYWSYWPMFAYMIKQLPSLNYQGIQLTPQNSYQYGPVCVDVAYRGQGVFESIFNFALRKMSEKFPVLLTFVNKNNPRSMRAHIDKAKLEVLQEFEYNNNHYAELICLTQRE